MVMDIQTQKTLWEFENLGLLWSILDAGLELGIINEGDEGVVIDVTAIAETAEQWNEPIEPRQADWFEGAGIVGVASLVNAYMEDPTSYQRGSVNSLVKLIGDKLLQTFEGKRVEIEF